MRSEFLNQDPSLGYTNIIELAPKEKSKVKSRKGGMKISMMDVLQLAMLCLLSCVIGCGASSVEAKNQIV